MKQYSKMQTIFKKRFALHCVLTAHEVAKRYHLDQSVVRRACIDGKVVARKAGRVWLISATDAAARWGKD